MAIRDRNQLPNPCFDEVSRVNSDYPLDWEEINSSNDAVTLKLYRDTSEDALGTVVPRTGKRMVRVGTSTTDVLAGDGIQLLFKVPLKASTSYVATAWLKTWFSGATDKANVVVKWYTTSGSQSGSTQSGTYVYGHSDWSASTLTATSPSDADTALFQVVGTGTGIYYIDSVELYEASQSYLTSTEVNTYTGTTSTEYTSTDHTSYQPMAVAVFENDVGRRIDTASDEIAWAKECLAHLCVHKKKVATYGNLPDSDWAEKGFKDDTSYQTYRNLVRVHFGPTSVVAKFI